MNLAVNARDAMPDGRQAHASRPPTSSSTTRYARQPRAARRRAARAAGGERHRRRHGRRRRRRASSSPSSRPRSRARAPASASRPSTASSSRAAATSGSTASPAAARPSRSTSPRADGEPAEPGAVAAHRRRSRGTETILLVEDEPEVRSVCARRPRSATATRVLEAGRRRRGARASCERARGPIHLLLTDVVMPAMSGRELARRACARASGHRGCSTCPATPTTPSSATASLEAGVAFLQKPFTPTALLRKVREVLDAPTAAGT